MRIIATENCNPSKNLSLSLSLSLSLGSIFSLRNDISRRHDNISAIARERREKITLEVTDRVLSSVFAKSAASLSRIYNSIPSGSAISGHRVYDRARRVAAPRK